MDYYIEDIGDIKIIKDLVYVDCVRREINEAGVTTAIERTGRLVLPLAAFVRMEGTITKAAEELVDRGILRRRDQSADDEIASSLEAFEIDLDETEPETAADLASNDTAQTPRAEGEATDSPKQGGRRRSRRRSGSSGSKQ